MKTIICIAVGALLASAGLNVIDHWQAIAIIVLTALPTRY